MKVMIIATLEISDHDRWCSGEEFIYEIKNRRYMRTIPDENINLDKSHPYWISLLPIPKINEDGSYYCTQRINIKWIRIA